MKRFLFLLAALLGLAATMKAQTVVDGVSVSGFRMERSGDYMVVDMTLDLSALDVDANRAVLLTPRLVNGDHNLDLPAIGIYGRKRYYFYMRNGESMLSGKSETSYKASQMPKDIAYNKVFPFESWMSGATLSLLRDDYGCCHTLVDEQSGPLGNHSEAFFPELVYVRPDVEPVKKRSLSGSAYIDFPVAQTVIYPDYRRNAIELQRIQATIDSVRDDSDVQITSVWLKGYASPESPYSNNRNLALGRTEALKKYIKQLYRFEEGIIATDYEPEDWEGLRRYVEKSNINHKQGILAIIDSPMEPDAKELKLRNTYPEEYRFLLTSCYPALRHTDYRISYNVRGYDDMGEIKRVMTDQPQKLSLNELFLLALQYQPGTDEFTDVFETAVRMYPSDKIANLNAANAAMRRGDNVLAERYLDKAGDSREAIYARGALAIRMGDLETARRYLKEAKTLGLEQAAKTLDELDNRKN